MAENENFEQKVKITYETNADEAAKDVSSLSSNMDKVTDSVDKTAKSTKNLEAIEKSFKTQLKEANQELIKTVQKYGETSAEAANAAKKVAELKDQMQFAKDLTDNFNPDQKFRALGAATQLASTATSGLVSGYALLGDEGEETTKMLLKVQAAMAFSDAVSNLSNLGDQWKVFRSTVMDSYNAIFAAKKRDIVATEAQTVAERIKNLVLMANPYIALAAAVVAVTIVSVAWIKSSREEAAARKAVSDSLVDNEAKLESLKDSIESYNEISNRWSGIDVLAAKARGESEEAVNKIILKNAKEEIEIKKQKYKEAQKAYDEATKNMSAAIQADDDELIEKARKNSDEAVALMKKTLSERQDSEAAYLKTQLQQEVDRNEKVKQLQMKYAEEAKQRREKERAEAEAAAKAKYDFEQNWLKMQNDAELAFLNEIDAAKKAYSDRLKTEEQVKIDDENARYQQQLENARKFNKDTEDLELEHLNILNDINLEAQQKRYDQEKAIEEAKLAYKQELQDAEIRLAESGAAFLSAIAGKNKTLQRIAILAESGVGIAKMIIANNAANIAALATPQAVATSGASAVPVIAFNNASTALGVGANIAATAKALSSLGGGGGAGSSSGSNQRGSAPPAGSSAPQVSFQGSSENQIAQSVSQRQAQTPIAQAFVVESELTNAQGEANRRREANSI